MKRSFIFLAAAAAFGLATVADGQTSPYRQPSPGPQPGDQAVPATQQAMPPGNEAPAAAAPSQPSAAVATRLAAIVPSGMTSEQACAEFRSLEECATALHLAQNLNIPFTDLKSKLKNGERVSAIIHDAKPQADPKVEVSRAQDQARADLGGPPQG